jgi:hypothetical protein
MSFLDHTQSAHKHLDHTQSAHKHLDHKHLEINKCYKLIENGTYLGELYQILLGLPMGGDRDVYYCFRDNDKKYRIQDYYIEKYGVKFELHQG